ncbi:MAG: VWA domain-containing protein [Phycisphaerales bacterium]|nr:VWA domain-containing protein [Phycisphaerales bacterium]
MTIMTGAQTHPTCGGTLAVIDGRPLPLMAVELSASARSGLAAVTLRQRFHNSGDDPVRLIYKLPLPADAAVGGFEFTFGEHRVVGEIRGRDQARKDFETALIEGRTAGLLEQERTSVFTQELGNVPPHTEVVCEITIDQRLRWLEGGKWEWRFPTVIPPRYLGEPGRVSDADRVVVPVASEDLPVRAVCSLEIRDMDVAALPESPTHAMHVTRTDQGMQVSLTAEGGVPLDRDVAIRWSAAMAGVGLSMNVARPRADADLDDAYAILTLTPPSPDAPMAPVPRSVCLLIDTSGSMTGEPLDLARRIAIGIVESLDARDTLEMIEFSGSARRWSPDPMPASPASRGNAIRWLQRLQAGGATEMQTAVVESLRQSDGMSQRQVILITDGFIGFEDAVTRLVRDLAASRGCRMHAVGVGSAPNRTLTGEVARAGGGGEFIIGLEEDPAEAAATVVAGTARPLCTDLQIEGHALLETPAALLPDLLAGAPARIPLRVRTGGGMLMIRGRVNGAPWSARVQVPACGGEAGDGSLPRLFARERVAELDATERRGPALDHRIEEIGLTHGIATRCTSWVAISETVTVDPTMPTRREIVPQTMAAGLSVEGLGLRARVSAPRMNMRRLVADADFLASSISEETRYSLDEFAIDQRVANSSAEFERRRSPSAPFPARLVPSDDNSAVIEVEPESPLAWDPVEVRYGARKLTFDPTSSTAAGFIEAGQVVRLVLTGVAGPTMLGKRVTIEMRDGSRLRVRVTPA